MNGFFFGPQQQEIGILGKAVKLLSQATDGNDGGRIIKLGLPKNEGKRRDEKINIRHPEQFCFGTGLMLEQPFQQARRIVLPSDNIIRAVERNYNGAYVAGNAKVFLK